MLLSIFVYGRVSIRAELGGPLRRASELHSQKITELLWLQADTT